MKDIQKTVCIGAKDIDDIIRAIKESKVGDVEFEILGDGFIGKIVKMESKNIELGDKTIFKGKNYINAINSVIQKAHNKYNYPISSYQLGLKECLGKKYLAILLNEGIINAKIPNQIKINMMGINKYKEYND